MSQPPDMAYIAPEDLRVGMYVHLDLSWMEHPFPSSSFKIKSESQIATIQSLGLRRIRVAPALSDGMDPPAAGTRPTPPDASPASPGPDADAPAASPAPPEPRPEAQARATPRMAEHLAAQKARERALTAAARSFKTLSREVYAQPAESRERARELIHQLAGSLLTDADVTLHLMAERIGSEVVYHHSLNVALLAMLLARAMKAPEEAIALVGLGALFHDIGKNDIPERVWRKTEPWTKAEQSWVEQHPLGGLAIAQKMDLPPEAQLVIAQHHELADGSGYPRKLKGDQISLPARIVTVANVYDNLCNPVNPQRARTPHAALSAMYGLQRARFDPRALSIFVRCMGIYPPGTLVGLSDGSVAQVVAVNASRPLKPVVVRYDPHVPKEAAPLVALDDEPSLAISRTFKASELDADARAYLLAQGRMTYFVDSTRRSGRT